MHRCSDPCYCDFIQHLLYSTEEIVEIEKGTKGQSNNPNWKKARRELSAVQTLKPCVILQISPTQR